MKLLESKISNFENPKIPLLHKKGKKFLYLGNKNLNINFTKIKFYKAQKYLSFKAKMTFSVK